MDISRWPRRWIERADREELLDGDSTRTDRGDDGAETLAGEASFKLRGRHSRVEFEGAVEGSLGAEPGVQGDLDDGDAIRNGPGQPALDFLDTVAVHRSGKGDLELLIDDPGQLVGGDGQSFGERLKSQIFVLVEPLIFQVMDGLVLDLRRDAGRGKGFLGIRTPPAGAAPAE